MTLTLSRKVNEQIVIGNNGEIVITVVAIRGNTIRIGIDAPNNVSVHRGEVFESIQAGNKGELGKLEEAATQPVPQIISAPQETPYQQFIRYLDDGNFREAGKIYVERKDFEASHMELDKLSKGLYR